MQNVGVDFYVLLFLAEFLGTVGGFGSSLFLVPIISYYFGFQQALLLTAGIHVVSNLWKVVLFRHGLMKKLLISFGIPSVIMVVIGAIFSKYLPDAIAEGALGIFLVALSTFLMIRPNYVVKPTTTNTAIGGGLSGLVAGLLGTGGAIRGLSLSAYAIEKNAFIATSAFIDLGVDASRFVVYVIQVPAPPHIWQLALPTLIISLAGNFAGKWIVDRMEILTFRRVVLFFILAVGVVSIGKAVNAFWG